MEKEPIKTTETTLPEIKRRKRKVSGTVRYIALVKMVVDILAGAETFFKMNL